MPVFANRAAPIQITWLGFNASTGIDEMDHILMDKIVAPKNRRSHFSENILYMPNSYLCFSPPNYEMEILQTPALKNNFITYGSLNNATKVNSTLLRVWAEILNKTDGSNLLLGGNHYSDEVA